MKKLLWLAGLLGLFYGHAWWTLSEQRAQRWIEQHELAVLEQKEGVCKDFTFDTEVSVRAVHAKGEWQLDGGRDHVCGYIKSSNAFVRVLKPQLSTQTQVLSFERAGFPWMSATAKVQQTTTFTLVNGLTMSEQGEATYVLRRGLSGLQIAGLTLRSEGNFPR